MGYEVVHTDDVALTDLSQVEEIPPDLDIRAVDEALGTEQMKVKVWYFDPGEEIQYHAHSEQEELYYIMEGEFSLKLGKSGEEEFVEAGPGTFYVAGPETGHGHRYVGEDRGVVLALGAPAVDDPGLDPHSLDD
ncbi:cupin domain-containing protein [Halomarina litorea]|uniref:cupin domain-containing protein n=1 Tax=Halomarina litorea TaxID=2961595 RepID=UPI0020C52CF9|nr:cupin domain-containing protein [Halomarina sp. BCD28]